MKYQLKEPMNKSIKDLKIFIAGHKGMVGSSCWKLLKENGYHNLIGKTSKELDIRDQNAVKNFFQFEKPDIVIDAAARVGGILANSNNPYDFILDNLLIQNNLIKYSNENDVKKFIFLGSSCIYPKFSKQPLKEEYLLTSSLEETNQWYAIAKIAGVKLVESIRIQFKKDFVSLMPTNLYGPGDNYNLQTSHVMPALIKKFINAKKNNLNEVIIWGSGNPLREFMYVDDLSHAIKFTLENKLENSIYNVGSGIEISINELSMLISKIVGFQGEIKFDSSKPDGTYRKILDSSKFNNLVKLKFTSLEKGIKKTIKSYLNEEFKSK